jgi:AcrR family transcriptional regulator
MLEMTDWKQWLLTSVATEYGNKGLASSDFNYIAASAGINKKNLDAHFPGKKDVIFSLIDEIAKAHKSYVLGMIKDMPAARERLVHFIVAGLEFAEKSPALARAIIQGLFSTETEIRDHVYEVYEGVFELMMDDLEEEGIIHHRTNAIISDLTTILLSAVFTGGCPQLLMEYTSWVDLHKVANSILDALQRRYQSHGILA